MMMRCVSREKGPRTPKTNNTVIYPVEIVQTMKINGFTKGEGMEKEKKKYIVVHRISRYTHILEMEC